MSPDIEQALQACLDAIEHGRPAEEALVAWPDPAERAALAPLLAEATALRAGPGMDAARRSQLADALARAEQSLYPPPAGGLFARIPAGPAALLVLLGAGLVAWWLLAGRSAPPDPAAPPITAPHPARADDSEAPLPAGGAGNGSTSAGGAEGREPPDAAGPTSGGDGGLPTGTAALDLPRESPVAAADTPVASAVTTAGPSAAGTERFPAPGGTQTARAVAPSPTPLPGAPRGDRGAGRTGAAAPQASATPARLEVTGTVMDAGGRGIAGALVSAYPLGAPGFYLQRSSDDGTYRLRLRPGSYVLHASAEGYAGAWHGGTPHRAEASVVDVATGRSPTGIDFWLQAVHPDTGEAGPPPSAAAGGPAQGGP